MSFLKADRLINLIFRKKFIPKASQLYVVQRDHTTWYVVKPPAPMGEYGLLWDDERGVALMVYPTSYPWFELPSWRFGLLGKY